VILIWFKRVLAALGLVLLLAAAAAGVYIYRASPALDGELRAAGLLGPVSVARDPSDVTHIKAQSPRDAWFALGYVHAQERGWQLEFNRRVMHGELSEVFGPATLETDKLLRTLGVVRAAERQWQTLPAEGRDAMQAYSEGISAFYAGSSQALPPEFHIVGTRPGGASGAAWSPVDSLAWSLMMALDLGGNWGTEFARLSAARVLKTGELWQLFPPYPGEQPASNVDFAKLYADMGVYRTDLLPALPQKSGQARRLHGPRHGRRHQRLGRGAGRGRRQGFQQLGGRGRAQRQRQAPAGQRSAPGPFGPGHLVLRAPASPRCWQRCRA
jgi:penicillin amidase